jgi:hypothetical protein
MLHILMHLLAFVTHETDLSWSAVWLTLHEGQLRPTHVLFVWLVSGDDNLLGQSCRKLLHLTVDKPNRLYYALMIDEATIIA